MLAKGQITVTNLDDGKTAYIHQAYKMSDGRFLKHYPVHETVPLGGYREGDLWHWQDLDGLEIGHRNYAVNTMTPLEWVNNTGSNTSIDHTTGVGYKFVGGLTLRNLIKKEAWNANTDISVSGIVEFFRLDGLAINYSDFPSRFKMSIFRFTGGGSSWAQRGVIQKSDLIDDVNTYEIYGSWKLDQRDIDNTDISSTKLWFDSFPTGYGIRVKNYMFTLGNKKGSYSPAPEDLTNGQSSGYFIATKSSNEFNFNDFVYYGQELTPGDIDKFYPKFEGSYTDYNKEQSDNQSLYTWRLIKADAGVGIKSIEEFYAISNSDSVPPTEWKSSPISTTTTKRFLWNYEKYTYTDNTESETKKRVIGTHGSTGSEGNGVSKITNYYLASNLSSGITTATFGWTTSIQSTDNVKKYLWNYELISYTNNSNVLTTPVIIGTYGDTGMDGQGVQSITPEFYLSTSKTSQTGGSWKATPDKWENGKWMWARNKIVYVNPSKTEYTDPTIDTSWEAIDGMEIGGRNLLVGSKDYSGTWVNKERWAVSSDTHKGTLIASRTGSWNGLGQRFNVFKGEQYTFSAYVKSTSTSVMLYVANQYDSAGLTPPNRTITLEPDTWTYVVCVISVYSDGVMFPRFEMSTNDETVYVSAMKLERGNKATDWSPAPEDTDSKIDSVRTWTESQIEQTNNSITSSVKEVTEKINGVDKKVNEIEVGQRNYIINSESPIEVTGNGKANQSGYPYSLSKTWKDMSLSVGDEVTVSFDIEIEGSRDFGTSTFRMQTDQPWFTIYPVTYLSKFPVGKNRVTYTYKFDSEINTSSTNKKVGYRLDGVSADTTIVLSNMKIEKGNKATDWSAAPEDTTGQIETVRKWAETEIKQTNNNITSSVKEVTEKVDGLSYENRNLLLNTNLPTSMTGTGGYQITANKAYLFSDKEYVRGKRITFSVDISKTSGTTGSGLMLAIGGTWQSLGILNIEDIPVDTPKRYTFTLTVKDSENRGDVYFQTSNKAPWLNGTINLSNAKFEIGNKPTQWSAAPEDSKNFPAWSNSPDGSDGFTRIYPNENLWTDSLAQSGYVSSSGATIGEFYPSTEVHRAIPELIPVSGTNIMYQHWNPSKINNTKNSNRIAFFREDRTFISHTTILSLNGEVYRHQSIPLPTGTEYVRLGTIQGLSTARDTSITFKFELGSTPTTYTTNPQDSLSGSIPKYVGFSPQDSDNPKDYAWMTNPDYVENSSREYAESKISQTSKDIMMSVTESFVGSDEFGEYRESVGTQFDQTAKDFNFIFKEIQEGVSKVEQKGDENYSNIQKYIRFEDGNIILGSTDSNSTLKITKDEIAFMQGGSKVAYFSGQSFYIDKGILVESMQVGEHRMTKGNNGHTTFDWIG